MPKIDPPLSVPVTKPDEWARTWGETMTKTRAAKALGISRPRLYDLLKSKKIGITFDGRVITRSLCEYVTTCVKQSIREDVPDTPKLRLIT